MRDPVPSSVEPLAIVVAVLVTAIITIPVVIAVRSSYNAAQWRVTSGSVWGQR